MNWVKKIMTRLFVDLIYIMFNLVTTCLSIFWIFVPTKSSVDSFQYDIKTAVQKSHYRFYNIVNSIT